MSIHPTLAPRDPIAPRGPIGPVGYGPYAQTIDGLRAVTKTILMYPRDFAWSVQGFGMLRTYIDSDKKYRLNIWDSSLAVPNVSIVHDHPWSFTSWVLSGRFRNVRYDEVGLHEPGASDSSFPEKVYPLYDWAVIRTGPGGGPEGERGQTRLRAHNPENYKAGDVYHQEPTEIHASYYDDGTVTVNDRVRLPDGDHARVFWQQDGREWVDAEPRDATEAEVARVTWCALEKWSKT